MVRKLPAYMTEILLGEGVKWNKQTKQTKIFLQQRMKLQLVHNCKITSIVQHPDNLAPFMLDEISSMGKTNENTSLICKKYISLAL
jgi:hypothetical protein